MALKCILVDDEQDSLEVTRLELVEHCPNVEVVASYTDAREALQDLPELDPDLIFLDIEMPKMNGFEFLKQAEGFSGQVIFVTAYDSFAIQAIKAAAADYLLKPLSGDELKLAVKRATERLRKDDLREEVIELIDAIRSKGQANGRVTFPTSDGFEFVDTDSIIYCQGDNNYTHVHRKAATRLLISRTLKSVEEMLVPFGFVRVHNSYLVNPNHIVRFVRNDGGYLIMSDDTRIPIARSRRSDFLKDL
ncbi:MAG: response regulator transcription factor [Flavobacteriales bacterium]|nr:response regulator transcription factor [Flavobacteriales bacterium]